MIKRKAGGQWILTLYVSILVCAAVCVHTDGMSVKCQWGHWHWRKICIPGRNPCPTAPPRKGTAIKNFANILRVALSINLSNLWSDIQKINALRQQLTSYIDCSNLLIIVTTNCNHRLNLLLHSRGQGTCDGSYNLGTLQRPSSQNICIWIPTWSD